MSAGGRPGDGRLRVLLDGAGPADWNMAVDAALLQAGGPTTLRLYGWQPHAVSLGYFQAIADFADLPPGTPIVRRCTGGGAIHHGDELTFALTGDLLLLPRDIAASHRLLHDAVVAALGPIGVPCRRQDHGPANGARPQQRWCFAEPGRDDVVTGAGKLVGSAQRRVERPDRRFLHHGSLVLRRPALTPFVGAVEDHVQPDATLQHRLRAALIDAFAAALDLIPVTAELSADERAVAATVQRQRYHDPAFLHRR